MAKIKLTKTELKAQSDALKRFLRFLPMLQLKKQQLQAEIAGIAVKCAEVHEKEREAREALTSWIGLFATGGALVEDLVQVEKIDTDTSNIAGVPIPVFNGIETKTKEFDLWTSPPWVDNAVEAVTQILSLQCERIVLDRQRELVMQELQTTSQRVNLFEKVKIPECRENIRVIKIAIGDEQTAAVTRGKIAKSRSKGADTEAESGKEVA